MCSHRVSGPYRFRDFFCRLGLEIERMREKNREKNRERENERGWQTGHTCGLCYVNLPLCLSPPPADETRRAIGVGRQRVIKFNSWPRIGGSSLLSPRFPSFPGETVGPITDRLEFTWLLTLRSLPDYPPCPKKSLVSELPPWTTRSFQKILLHCFDRLERYSSGYSLKLRTPESYVPNHVNNIRRKVSIYQSVYKNFKFPDVLTADI